MEPTNDKTPVEQDAVASGDAEKNQVAYETYQKVLNAEKSAKGKLSTMEQELQSLREEKLKREGNLSELVEQLKAEKEKLSSTLTKKEQTYAWNTLTSEIKRTAQAQGCTDPDKLIRLMSDEDMNSIEVGENFSINTESLKNVIEKNKKENHFLFKQSSSAVINANPTTKPQEVENKLKDLSKLSMDELRELHLKTYK